MMETAKPPRSLKVKIKLKRHVDNSDSSNTTANHLNKKVEEEPNALSSPNQADINSTPGIEDHSTEDEENRTEDSQYQLVLYDPAVVNGSSAENEPEPTIHQSPYRRPHPFSDQTQRVLPSIGAFTVQCANCFKWRFIPTKEKYEEIREHIIEQPFSCETAREWRPDISCDDDPDITQDGSRLWAIDKPSISQAPPGWQRLLRIRGEGSTKFADVYYVAPTGKRLRSMVEIQKYLSEHLEYMDEGVHLSQFSFQIPRPLQENYVRKRPAHPAPIDLPPSDVKSITWVSADVDTDLQLSRPMLSNKYFESSGSNLESQPAKKKRKKRSCNGDLLSGYEVINIE